MALDPNRWTHKTQEAFTAAVDAAPRPNSNPEVTPDHLLAALLRQDEGIVLPIAAEARHRPRSCCATGPTRRSRQLPEGVRRREPRLAASCDRVVRARRQRAQGAARRVPVDRAPAAGAWPTVSASTREELLAALREVRGSAPRHERRTPRSSTRRSRSTAATSPRRRARASSTRSSGATRRSAASSRCCRAARRTTRCSSASPASARPRSSRGSPAASSRATCPRV